MATLFDNLNKAPTPLTQPQDQIAKTLAAKSGKAVTGAPKIQSLAANVAQAQVGAANRQQSLAEDTQAQAATQAQQNLTQQTNLAQQKLDVGTALQRAQMATQRVATTEGLQAQRANTLTSLRANETTQIAQTAARADRALRELTTNRNLTVNDLLADKERSDKDLAFRKDAAELEQIGFLLSLRDKDYLAELDRIGRTRQLTDDIQWNEEKNRIVFGTELDRLRDDLTFKRVLNADRRTYESELAQMDINWALEVANAAIAQANNQAMIEGGTQAVQAGVDYYAGRKPQAPARGGSGINQTQTVGNTPDREF